ncbi:MULTISPECIES: hypothetical protein [Methylobacterium]|uniref:Uncharacterized protein n=1 Tax=Methylobacterium thuringiense TaxID=1003091 RepID=A0ABQ4TKW9_9HYPH|nr:MULTISPECIES: hypothetical protein [Methylobacterium]TXN25122.1 hypothetical protein FV217_00900 [Methylobacterium sp. WL9]GJE54675.1 hypothetical protein EKPJFOCH_1154 [Methylobacterium thuringiense]
MRLHWNARARKPLAVGLAAAGLIVMTVGVHAQDGGSFFDMLFGAQPRQAAPVAPAYGGQGAYGDGYRRRARSDRRHAWKLKTRYAALPRAEAVKGDPDKILGKQPVDQKAILDNPTKALLEDKTLRPGDIVVMPGGPKVFTGGSEKRHRMSDFEDVKHSRMVDRKTRGQLLAMMVPLGAMPADQARKVMAVKLKLATQDEIEAAEAGSALKEATAGPRMIMPWKTTP